VRDFGGDAVMRFAPSQSITTIALNAAQRPASSTRDRGFKAGGLD